MKGLDKIIKDNNHLKEAYNCRGLIKSKLKEKKIEAIEDFDEAIKIEPRYYSALYNRADAYGDIGKR